VRDLQASLCYFCPISGKLNFAYKILVHVFSDKFKKIRPVGGSFSMRTGGRTGMMKLTVGFRQLFYEGAQKM
jgi:hypothetical protein